ncbi:MAG: HU family DNA-binding protein [Microcoleaceae cyanobacterium]
MKKAELIQKISEQTNFPKGKVKAVIDMAFDTLSEEIKKGEKVALPNFGTFIPKDRPATTKTNPETGETVDIPARKVINFRPAQPKQA